MAIIVEEEKKGTSWITILSIVVVLLIVFLGGYYLFFKKPELIEVVVPEPLQVLGRLSQAKFEPQEVVDSPTFKALRDYATPLTLPAAGRADPFRPR